MTIMIQVKQVNRRLVELAQVSNEGDERLDVDLGVDIATA